MEYADGPSPASTLCAEIGYGNAAGLLFRKGISGPPPGKLQTIDDVTIRSPTLDIRHPNLASSSSSASSSTLASHSLSAQSPTPLPPQNFSSRNPITSLVERAESATLGAAPELDPRATFDSLSDAEKEAETVKLLDLFDRLDRNPILSARAPTNTVLGQSEANNGETGGGDGDGKKIGQVLRERYVEVDRVWSEKERLLVEDEELEDEESGRREMEAYRRRMGR